MPYLLLPYPLPLKGKSMADRAMNSFPVVTDAAYVYAESADGSQVKIKKSDLASVVANQIGLNTKNIRKQLAVEANEILNLGVRGGLIVFNTTAIQEQCVALFSCYGDSTIQLLSSNTSFIVGSRTTNTANKLVLFREDSTNLCYIKNTFANTIPIAYQVVGGFW